MTKLKPATDTDAEYKRGWTPRRRGAIYCSPRCGADCTHEAYMTATRKAKALCKRLGKGWEPYVWENMGWFYSAHKGVTEVYANYHKAYPGGVLYRAYFNSAKQFFATARTPEKALRLAVGEVRAAVRKLNHDLREIAA